ncbi:hypothetical protein GCM10010289_83310 [Streptomyces violascens]|uniref:Uncharacterized protein n=1 Tax=Streptomyces violascens TaxID=67381 RepID=A0ABQ3QSU7_9ACTN|nr:hypothetical protein GCM10010289_83310 [Streptomyces violascens]GHI40359.1 hypothetical protein Sviol_47670 [Streptomyces violascens]
MEGARGARGRAFHQGATPDDCARVRHAADQCFVICDFTLSCHIDHVIARSAA